MIPRINIIFLGFPASNSDNYSRDVSDSTSSLVSTSEANAPRWKSAGSSRRVILELKPTTTATPSSNASNSRPASHTVYDVVCRAARRNLASDEAISKCFGHVRKGIVTQKPSWGLTVYSGAPDFSLINMGSDCDMLRDGETLLVVWSPLDQFLHSQDPVENDPFLEYPQEGLNALAVQSASDDKTEFHRSVQIQGSKKPSTDLRNRPAWVHPTSKANVNEKPGDPRTVRRGSVERKTPHPPTPAKKIPPQLQSQKSSSVNVTNDASRHSISSVSSSSNARDSVRPMTPIPHGKNWDHPMGQLANNFSTSYLNFEAEPSPLGAAVPGGRSAEPTALTAPIGHIMAPQTAPPVTFNEPSQPPPWWPPGRPALTANPPPPSTTPNTNMTKTQTYSAPPIPQELNTDLLMQALMKLFAEASMEGKPPDVQKITSIFLTGPLGSQIQHAALESLLGGSKSHLIESFLASHKPELETVMGSISLPPQLGVSKKRDQNPVEVKNAVAKLVVDAVTSPLGQQLEHTALQAVLGVERTTQVEQLMTEHKSEILAAAGMISHVTGVNLVNSNPAATFAQDMLSQAAHFANARQIVQTPSHNDFDKHSESHTSSNAIGSAFQNAQKWLHSSDDKQPSLPEKTRAAVLLNENATPVVQQLSSFMASLHHGHDANTVNSKDLPQSTRGSEIIYKEPSEPPPWWPKGKPALTLAANKEAFLEEQRIPSNVETRQSAQRQVPQLSSNEPSRHAATHDHPNESTGKSEPSFISKMQSMFTEDPHIEHAGLQSHSAMALLSKVQHYLETEPEPSQSRSVKYNEPNESHAVGDKHIAAKHNQPHNTLLSKMQSLISNDSDTKAEETATSKHQHPSQGITESFKTAGTSLFSKAQQFLAPEHDEEESAVPTKPTTQHASKPSSEAQHDPHPKPYLKKKTKSDDEKIKPQSDGAMRAKMLALLNAESDDDQSPPPKAKEKVPEKKTAGNKPTGKLESAETRSGNFLSKVHGLLDSEPEMRVSGKQGSKNQSKESSKPPHHDLKKPHTSKASSKAAAENADTKPRSDGALRAKLLSMLDAESDIETTFGKPAHKKESPVEKKRGDSNKSTTSTSKPKSRESSAGSEKKPQVAGNSSSFRSKTQALLHDDSEKKAMPKKPSKSDNPPVHSTNPKSKTQPTLKKRDSSASSLETTDKPSKPSSFLSRVQSLLDSDGEDSSAPVERSHDVVAKDASRVPNHSNNITKGSHKIDDDPPKSSFLSKMQAALESETDTSSPPSRKEKSPDSSLERPRAKRPNSADKRGTTEKGAKAKTHVGIPKDQPNQQKTALRRPQTSRTQLNDRDQNHSKSNPTSSAKKPIPHSSSKQSLQKDESQHPSKSDPKSNLRSKMLGSLFGDDSEKEAKHDSDSEQEAAHDSDSGKRSSREKKDDQGLSKSHHMHHPDSNAVKPSSESSPITKLKSKMLDSLFIDDSDSASGNDSANKRKGTFLSGALDSVKDATKQEKPISNSRIAHRGLDDANDLETSVSSRAVPPALPEKSLLESLKLKADAAVGDFKKALGRNADGKLEEGIKEEKIPEARSRGIEPVHDSTPQSDSKNEGLKPGKYVRSRQSSVVSSRDSLAASQVLGSSKLRHRTSATRLVSSQSFDKLVVEGKAVLEKLADGSNSDGSTPPQRRKSKTAPPKSTASKKNLASTSFGNLEDMASDSDSGARRGRTGRKPNRRHESVESLHSLNSENGSKAGSDYHESVDSMSDTDSKHAHKASRTVSSPPHSRSKEVKKPTPTSKQTSRQRANSSDLDDSDGSEPRYKTHSAAKTKDGNAHLPRNGAKMSAGPTQDSLLHFSEVPISERGSVWSQMDERGRAGFNTIADYELRTKKVVLDAEVKKCQAEACVKQSTIEWEIQKLQTESKKADRDVELRKVELEMLRKDYPQPPPGAGVAYKSLFQRGSGLPYSYLFLENGFHLRKYNSRANLFRVGLSNITMVAAGTLLHRACIRPTSPTSIKWGFAALLIPFAVGCVVETGLGVTSYLKAVFRGHDVLDEFEEKPPLEPEPEKKEKEWEALHFEDSTDTLADI
ncbi:hypothetical protein HDU80_002124 [Chytriomyces hyalinus]|nr:hypothetical protein HDU80_002124 [Chytriomyces hyalinus]